MIRDAASTQVLEYSIWYSTEYSNSKLLDSDALVTTKIIHIFWLLYTVLMFIFFCIFG